MWAIVELLALQGSIVRGFGSFQIPLRGRGRHERGRRATANLAPASQYRQAPPALEAFLSNMLLADLAPEDIVVSKAAPVLGDLGSTTEGSSVEVGENLERDFAGKDNEGVYSYEVAELFCEERELGKAAHGEDALEDKLPPGVGGGGKVGPD